MSPSSGKVVRNDHDAASPERTRRHGGLRHPDVSQYKTWSLPVAAPALNRLDIVARNVSAMTVNRKRARLSCDATLAVDTDGPLTVNLDGCNRQVRYP